MIHRMGRRDTTRGATAAVSVLLIALAGAAALGAWAWIGPLAHRRLVRDFRGVARDCGVRVDELHLLAGEAARREFRRQDPDSRIVPTYGLSARCSVSKSEVARLTEFRRRLRDHENFDRLQLNVSVVWQIEGEPEEDAGIRFSLVLWERVTASPLATR